MKTRVEIKRLAWLTPLCALLASTALAANLQFVSLTGSTAEASLTANGDSALPVVSADGRLVLFASTADNLTTTTNGGAFLMGSPAVQNVFVRDLIAGTNALVSVDVSGVSGGNGRSTLSAISTNNQFVVFESDSSNLIPGDTNNATDVFRRDLAANTTTLVSVATNGRAGNRTSWNAVATPDGRFVAFVSAASNLAPNDTNGIPDVFLRDLQTGTTWLVSVGAQSTLSATLSSTSETPALSDDGRYVAFYSSATNLVPGVGTAGEVYVRDLQAGTTLFASTNAQSLYQTVKDSTNAVSCGLRLSADGNYVAFATVPATNFRTASALILRYSLATGLTEVIHTNAYAALAGPGFPFVDNLDLTPDGRFVTYAANVTATSGTNTAIYLWDAQIGTTRIVSLNTNNVLPEAAFCDSPRVSTNGQFVAFLSTATGLVTNALTGQFHLYLRDMVAGDTSLVDADTNGTGAGGDFLSVPVISAAGSRVFFESASGGLVANDRNRAYDVFMRSAVPTATTLISAIAPPLASVTPNGNSLLSAQPISQDGRFIAFASHADNLVPGDTNQVGDVFVRDLLTGSNILVSVSSNGAMGESFSSDAVISGNGRYVAFTSIATNFFAGDTNNAVDVFVRDLQTGTTLPVSVRMNGSGTGNSESYSPTISTDGRYVLFRSKASDLAPGTSVVAENLFLRDQQAGTNFNLTGSGRIAYAAMTPDGRFVAFIDFNGASSGQIYLWDSQLKKRIGTNSVTGSISSIGISPDGNRIAYYQSSGGAPPYGTPSGIKAWERSSNSNRFLVTNWGWGFRFSADSRWLTYSARVTTTNNQVYLYDFQRRTNLLVSHALNLLTYANAAANSPDISADGRFVVYRTAASNLVPGFTNGVPAVLLYDSATGTNTLLSMGTAGNLAANNRSFTPAFSGDGRTLIFGSWGSDLAAGDFNSSSDVLAFQFLYAVIAGTNGANPVISWPALPGQLFHVEYKDNLSDPLWQTVVAPVTITGNRGLLTDPAPGSGSRFYRVVRKN